MRGMLDRLVAVAGRRPTRVLVVVTVLAVIAAGLALRLSPSAATDTLVGSGSDTYQATERYREEFGDHSVIILVKGDLPSIVLTDNLGRLLGLEGCIAGNKPPEIKEPPGGKDGPCARFAATKPVQVVYGPGTFLNSAVGEIQQQLAAQLGGAEKQAARAERAARKVARSQGRSRAEARRMGTAARQAVEAQVTRDLLDIALRYGLSVRSANPQLDNPDFVSALVFDPARCSTCPKARFAYLFPNQDSAVIQVRLKPSLSDQERSEAIGLVREAVAMEEWKLRADASYVVTGAPVLVDDLTSELSASLLRLLVLGVLVMALVLALVFRSRLRLLPLGVAMAAVALVFGLMSVLGLPLTMASIAVLPVLLGLGVDYAIQYQARVEEGGLARARRAVPTIGAAVVATVAGFLVLLLSPVPMVRGFGVLLVVGIVFAYVLALTLGTAALVRAGRSGGGLGAGRLSASLRGAGDLLEQMRLAAAAGAGWVGRRRGIRGLVARGRRAPEATLRAALGRPGRVIAVGFVLAFGGWVLDTQHEVQSDIQQLVPGDLPAVRDVVDLQETTSVAGEIDVIVEADTQTTSSSGTSDLTDPKVVAWMRDYQKRLLDKYEYSSKTGCGEAEICPALSLPDLFRSPEAASDQEAIRALLDAVPPYFSQAVITEDRRTASLAFGIKLMPLDRQKEVIDTMRAELDPPEGVTARLAGLPVLAAEANAALSEPLRRLGTLLAGLLVVALALLLVYRRWERAWVPLVPIAMATGWSAFLLFVLGIPLNPMSATLGALVIAISTEFTVLLVARFREERDAGWDVADALRRTYASTGAAVLASGITAIAGFAVLALSDVTMLREFGFVTVINLSVSLLGVMAVLPAVLVVAERRRSRRSAGGGPSGRGGGRAADEPELVAV